MLLGAVAVTIFSIVLVWSWVAGYSLANLARRSSRVVSVAVWVRSAVTDDIWGRWKRRNFASISMRVAGSSSMRSSWNCVLPSSGSMRVK